MAVKNENKMLQETIQSLNKTIELLNQTVESLRDDLTRANENIAYLTKQLYGRKSEKTTIINGQQLISDLGKNISTELGENIFDEAEQEALESILEESPFEEPIKRTKKGYKRKEKFNKLPAVDIIYRLSEPDQICSVHDKKMHSIGIKFIRSEISYKPAEISIVNIYQESYECRTCKKEGQKHIFKAPKPEPLLQHSYASASSVAWTMYQKYVQAVPLYRQEKDWKHMGYTLERGTLANWITSTSEEWLSPFLQMLRQELLKRNYLHADETPVQVMGEDGRKDTTKSYMWVYTTAETSQKKIAIFDYTPGRSGDYAAGFLNGFKGYLHTDAYSGYDKVKGIKHCLCWAHLRRYFKDAMPKDIKSHQATLPAKGIAYCNKLFEWEQSFKHLNPEERKKKRLEKELPLLNSFWAWVNEANKAALPKSKIGLALSYALNQKEGLMTYLEDGNCVISNNLAENTIRPFVIGRKNWLFCGSPKGAQASATVYSLVETAKLNGLNPYKYLEKLLLQLPREDMHMTPEYTEMLMPWHPYIQESCKA